jgi:hypothetical protein
MQTFSCQNMRVSVRSNDKNIELRPIGSAGALDGSFYPVRGPEETNFGCLERLDAGEIAVRRLFIYPEGISIHQPQVGAG